MRESENTSQLFFPDSTNDNTKLKVFAVDIECFYLSAFHPNVSTSHSIGIFSNHICSFCCKNLTTEGKLKTKSQRQIEENIHGYFTQNVRTIILMFNLEQNKFIQTCTIAKDTKNKFNRGNLILSQRISFLKCVLEIVLITILQI